LTTFLGLAYINDLSSDIGGLSMLSSLNEESSTNSLGGGYNIFLGSKLGEKGFSVALTN